MIRNVLAVISLGLLNICWGFVGSMQAPFFPIEAEKRGASPSQFSPIFGFIHLATAVTSPFMAKVITRVGLGNVFKLSLSLIFVAAISFGCLTYVDDLVLFQTISNIDLQFSRNGSKISERFRCQGRQRTEVFSQIWSFNVPGVQYAVDHFVLVCAFRQTDLHFRSNNSQLRNAPCREHEW